MDQKTPSRSKENEPKTIKKRRINDDSLQRLIENNKRLNYILQKRTSIPVIWEGKKKILTGTTFSGTLLNTIESTNQVSPVLVKAHPNQGLPYNSKFSCQATSRREKVFCICNKLITSNKEIPIQAQLLNLNGSSGLEGEYEDGKEDLIAGAIISDFSKGVMSAAQDRIVTPFGSVQENSTRNQILQGAINSANTTSEILLEEMHNTVPKVTIPVGSKVLIYFMEAVNDY
jgi:hypothetical protein